MSAVAETEAALDALHAAVLAEDYAAAQGLMEAYDRSLRRTVAAGTAEREALERLAERQSGVLRAFIALRDEAAAALRDTNRAGRAARAYLQAG